MQLWGNQGQSEKKNSTFFTILKCSKNAPVYVSSYTSTRIIVSCSIPLMYTHSTYAILQPIALQQQNLMASE